MLLVPVVLVVATAAVALSLDPWHSPAPPGHALPSASHGRPATASSPVRGRRPRNPSGAGSVLPGPDLPGPVLPGPGPLAVARRAAQGLWSFDWTHPSDAAPASLRPLVTKRLWAELARSPGAPAASAALVGEHEAARVVSVTVSVADRSGAGVALAVSAEVVVSREGRPAVRGREYAEMLVTPTPAGWRVAGIDT